MSWCGIICPVRSKPQSLHRLHSAPMVAPWGRSRNPLLTRLRGCQSVPWISITKIVYSFLSFPFSALKQCRLVNSVLLICLIKVGKCPTEEIGVICVPLNNEHTESQVRLIEEVNLVLFGKKHRVIRFVWWIVSPAFHITKILQGIDIIVGVAQAGQPQFPPLANAGTGRPVNSPPDRWDASRFIPSRFSGRG